MKSKLSTLLLALLAITISNGQKLQHAFSLGNSSDQHARRVYYDKDGNMLLLGSFQGANLDVDPSSATFNLSSAGSYDFYVAKYSPAGAFINAIKIGGTGNDQALDLAVDSGNNIYVTGWFRGTVDFDPSTGVANVVSNGESGSDNGFDGETFVAKYNSNLQYQWAFGVGGPLLLDGGNTIKIDHSGNVLVGGVFQGTVDFDPSANTATLTSSGTMASFIAKYSNNGQYKWSIQFGGATTVNCEARTIGIDSINNIYVTGHFDGSIDLNPGAGVNNVTSSGCGDIYLVKLDSTANHLWGFKIGGGDCDYPITLSIDPSNKIYVCGYFKSTNVDFNPGTGSNILSSSGNWDGFVAKFDENGNYIFAHRFGNTGEDLAYDMMAEASGYVVVGYFSGTVDFDPSASTANLTSAGLKDIFVAHFSPAGNYLSSFRLGSSEDDAAYSVTLNDANEYTITGYFRGSNVDFDPTSGKKLLTSAGGNDIFLAKYTDLDLLNTLKGSVYFDKNSNGVKDPDENYFIGAKITTIKTGVDTIIANTSNGRFSFNVDTGQYITSVKTYVPYYGAVPSSITRSFTTYQNSDSISFAIQPIPGIKDLSVNMFSFSPLRPGFRTQYYIYYYNKGTDTIANGSVQLIKDSRFIFDSAQVAANTTNGDTLTWNFTNLAPRSYGTIKVYLKASIPPTVNIGDTLISKVTVFPVVGDSTPANNIFILKQRAVGSYDPNDKKEAHGGKLTTTQVTEGEYLQYTIRFQNTGTDTAFNINVRDTLSSKLDWNTMEMVTASHDYQLTISEGNRCYWNFANVNLVDSNTNESLSHGYIVFRIKPKSSLVVGDVIPNKASIYFDYNVPVVTNTESTTIVNEVVLPVKLISFDARRNGGENLLTWKTSQELNTSYFEIQKSDNGRAFISIGKVLATGIADAMTYSFNDKFPGKGLNYYRLRIVDKDGKSELSSVRKVNNTGAFDVSIFPNPVKSTLSIKIDADRRENVKIEIINLAGHVLSTQKHIASAGLNNINIDVSSLSTGTYVVRINFNEEQSALKFQKL